MNVKYFRNRLFVLFASILVMSAVLFIPKLTLADSQTHNLLAPQTYNTAKIRVKTSTNPATTFTRLKVCGTLANNETKPCYQGFFSNISNKDVDWWFKPEKGVKIELDIAGYGTRYCTIVVNQIKPPYTNGWVTISYLGENRGCTIANGYK